MTGYPSPLTYPGPGLYPVAATDSSSGLYAPALTPYTDFSPLPRVNVTFTSLDPACATLNVYRQARGRQMPVRGGSNLAVAGGAALVDVEAPYGIPLLYLAQQFDVDGNFLSNTGAAQTTVNSTATTVHNPFDPASGITCRIAVATGQTVAGQIPVSTYYPNGRQAGVAVTGQRRGLASTQVIIYADTLDVSDALDGMFGPINGDLGLPPFVCVRFSAALTARIRLPQPLFLAVPNPTQTPINLVAGGTRIGWDISGPEVDPPAVALAQAIYSRDDMDAAYLTRNARDAAYTSRLAMDTDYNFAGAAG